MRLPELLAGRAILMAMCVLVTGIATSADAPTTAAAGQSRKPNASAIQHAVVELRRDPNLGGETRVRTLKWSNPSKPRSASEPPRWIGALFDLLGQFSGMLLWVIGIVGVGFAAVWSYRNFLWEPRASPQDATAVAGRVLDLDITPGSLPDDVGAAAAALCRAGRLREALSLLYRASLSRAVNRFGVAIESSFTEGEALRAVRAALDAPRTQFFADVVRVWQRLVYAGEDVAVDAVIPLCERFNSTLDGASP